MMRNNAGGVLIALAAVTAGACTSFGAVRSAVVHPGPSVRTQLSLTSSTGDDAGWFWSWDCASGCDHSILGAELGAMWGFPASGGRAFAVGGGVSGLIYPYVDGYLQLRDGPRPFGVGARIGLPAFEGTWAEHQLYGRYDIEMEPGRRFLINPSIFLHAGNSPNGENPGHFLALVQGFGIAEEGENVTAIPAVSFVLGRGERASYGTGDGPFTAFFAVVSVSLTYHR